ncbi:hypothetical protein [Burkholderia oklahomensis]|nr:hypothetical protein [Burkholderia oklahomensis]
MQPHDMKGVFNVWGSCCDDRRDEIVRPVFMPGDFRCNGGLSQPFVISFEMMPRDPVIELKHLTEAADYRLVCIGMRKNGCNAIRRIVECRKRKNGGSIVSASARAYERKSGRFLGAPDALTERAPLPNIRGRSRG